MSIKLPDIKGLQNFVALFVLSGQWTKRHLAPHGMTWEEILRIFSTPVAYWTFDPDSQRPEDTTIAEFMLDPGSFHPTNATIRLRGHDMITWESIQARGIHRDMILMYQDQRPMPLFVVFGDFFTKEIYPIAIGMEHAYLAEYPQIEWSREGHTIITCEFKGRVRSLMPDMLQLGKVDAFPRANQWR